MVFNASYKVMQFCDDTQWVAIAFGQIETAKAPTSGLIAHWKLDESAGSTVTDSAGSVNGTIVGNPVWRPEGGRVGGALEFDGSGDTVVMGDAAALEPANITICLWARRTGAGDGVNAQILVDKQQWDDAGYIIALEPENTNIAWRILSTNSGGTYTINSAVTTSAWHHYCTSFDGTTSRLYVDGELRTSMAASYAAPSAASFRLGSNGGANYWFHGLMDDVRMYNRALSNTEVMDLYMWSGGAGGDPTGCSTIGQECSDGTIYAGLSPDGNIPMYTTHCDAGMTWSGSACTGTRSTFAFNNANASGDTVGGASSTTSGSANTASLLITDADSITGGTQPHQAAQYCGNLTASGRSDWYLPALDELAVLHTNRVAIGGFELNAGAAGEQRRLWSSTEAGQFTAWRQNMPDGVTGDPVKDEINTARCVRKVNPAGGSCTTPAGDEGDIIYNSTHHVMQYCNGTNWVPMGPNGNGGGGCSNPTGSAGDMTYNATHGIMQFCEGDTWVSMGPE